MMTCEIHTPKYAELFNQHPQWLDFFEKHNMPHFIASSPVASYLNSDMMYHLLQYRDIDPLVQCLEGDIQACLYLSSLYVKEGYPLPYHDIFSGDAKYQLYRGWRLFFSNYLQQYACHKDLIRFIMNTVDHIQKWEPYQINIALTLIFEWIQQAQKHGNNIKIFEIENEFEAFLCQVASVLYNTKLDLVLTRELCKRFHLTFEGYHSFDILLDHFGIWNGDRTFYTNEVHQLPERLVTAVRCENKVVFL